MIASSRLVAATSLSAVAPEPDPAVFVASVEAYANMMLHAGVKPASATKAEYVLRKLAREVGSPIWSSEQVEARAVDRLKLGIRQNTRRYEQITVEKFCDFLLDPNRDWAQRYLAAYGALPVQPITEANRIRHVEEDESEEHVRCVTWNELRAFFAQCDSEARNASSARSRRIALRDGSMYKVGAAYGMRDLEMSDCRLSECAPGGDRVTYGRFGSIRVFGKSKKYGTKRPRTIFTIGQFGWVAKVLENHVANVMPLFTNGDGDQLFVNENGGPLDPHYVSRRFSNIRDAAGLPKAVTSHGMRRLWATTLSLAGIDGWYISDQMGHESAATTARYVRVPADFIDRAVRRHQGELLTL